MSRVIILVSILLWIPSGALAQTVTIEAGNGSTTDEIMREVAQRLLQLLPPVQSYLSQAPASTGDEPLLRLEALLSGNSLQTLIAGVGSTTLGIPQGNVECPAITRLLTIGSQGEDVTALQAYLIATGFLSIEAPTGYFGTVTQASVQAWQSARGIVTEGTPQTTGFGAVGPMTREALQNCTA
jgi:hypothetical protein